MEAKLGPRTGDQPGGARPGPEPQRAIQEAWGRVVRSCGTGRPFLRAVVTNSELVSVDGDAAVLRCQAGFVNGAQRNKEAIEECLSKELGRAVRVTIESAGGAGDSESSGSTTEAADASRLSDSGERSGGDAALEHPLVKSAIQVFGAKVVDVQVRKT